MTHTQSNHVHTERFGLLSMFAGIVAIPTAILVTLFAIAKALH